jgi:hypothetical protein
LNLDVDRHGGVYPLLAIAKGGEYDIAKLSVRQSFNRAARKLAEAGGIEIRGRRWPSR